MQVTIFPSHVAGQLRVPPSKSHTMRAVLFAALANGQSRLKGLLESPDTTAMMEACRSLGAAFHSQGSAVEVVGTRGRVHLQGSIDCGNSGQVLRFMAAIGAVGNRPFSMTGDASIRTRRPVHDLIQALQEGGVQVEACQGRPPLQICGPLRPGLFHLEGQDSQPVSALLMASSLLDQPSTIRVHRLGERPWVGLTVWWLRRCGAQVRWTTTDGCDQFEVAGGWVPPALETQIPGDWSSAAFPLLAGLLAGAAGPLDQPDRFLSEGLSKNTGVWIDGLAPDDPQGDRELLGILQKLGAKVEWRGESLHVQQSCLQGGRVDANAIIDAVPILAAAAPFTQSGLCVVNVAVARRKESDRLEAMAEGLRRCGASVELGEDWIQVHPARLRGATLETHQDHRVAMALSVAALAASEPVVIQGVDCVAKSYPGFFTMLQALGARVEVVE